MSGTAQSVVRMANQIARNFAALGDEAAIAQTAEHIVLFWDPRMKATAFALDPVQFRSEEHTSELQSLMRISYAVFCLKKKKTKHTQINTINKLHIDNNNK